MMWSQVEGDWWAAACCVVFTQGGREGQRGKDWRIDGETGKRSLAIAVFVHTDSTVQYCRLSSHPIPSHLVLLVYDFIRV